MEAEKAFSDVNRHTSSALFSDACLLGHENFVVDIWVHSGCDAVLSPRCTRRGTHTRDNERREPAPAEQRAEAIERLATRRRTIDRRWQPRKHSAR